MAENTENKETTEDMKTAENTTKPYSVFDIVNSIGMAAFFALTIVQSVMGIWWIAVNTFAGENGKSTVFHYKEIGSFVLMCAVVYFLIENVVKKVMGSKAKPYCYAAVTAYIMSLPMVISVNYNATLYAVCTSLLLLLVLFSLRYFYGIHEHRLFQLIGVFAILVLLSYLNRPAFWTGVLETFVFLTIQLVRNIGVKNRNMNDKSWRNTLLLFCILIIIMLMPQYCSYNNIKHTLYNQSIEEQLSARVIIPYLEYEKGEKKEEYLLGVIKYVDYDSAHSYKNFKSIIHRYEEDNLDMDTIWKNLYTNAYYRYRNTIVKRYLRDYARGIASPFMISSEMKSETFPSHHGYYFSFFEKNTPSLSNVLFKYGLAGLFGMAAVAVVQIIGAIVADIATGKYKLKIEEGRHKKIEAIILIACFGFSWCAFLTLFSLEGTSFVTSIGAYITWILLASFTWFRKTGKED